MDSRPSTSSPSDTPTQIALSNYNPDDDYISLYNRWLYSSQAIKETTTETQIKEGGRWTWTVRKSVTFSNFCLKGVENSPSKKEATNHVCYDILQQIPKAHLPEFIQGRPIVFQADVDQGMGKDVNVSEKTLSTIITTATAPISSDVPVDMDLGQFTSSEPFQQFDQIQNKYMPFKTFNIATTHKFEDSIGIIKVPLDMLSDKISPNIIPFLTYAYSKLTITLKFVVSANQFQCGKVLCSVLHDPHLLETWFDTVQSGLSRQHIILDLNTNSTGELEIPYVYHRPLLRNVTHAQANETVTSSEMAWVYLKVLSPLNSPVGSSPNASITVMYKFNSVKLTGISYIVPQNDIDNLVDSLVPKRTLKAIIAGAEAAVDQLGSSKNQDKPSQQHVISIVPTPRMNFATGCGLSDVSHLKINPYAATNYNGIDLYKTPETVLDISRIWGIHSMLEWRVSQKADTVLAEIPLDPSSYHYKKDYVGSCTPLYHMSSMFAFWSGPLELRLDVVCTDNHRGLLLIAVEFNRPVPIHDNVVDRVQIGSTYVKYFHVGEQKQITLTIPYIFDTPYRRTNNLYFQPDLFNNVTANDTVRKASMNIGTSVRSSIKIVVVNPLSATTVAADNVQVLVFLRGSPSFNLLGLVQSSVKPQLLFDEVIHSFPKFTGIVSKPDTTARSFNAISATKSEGSASLYNPKYKSKDAKAASTGKNDVVAQGDVIDTTDDFASHMVSRVGITTSDVHTSISDILRANVLMYHNIQIAAREKHAGYFLPLMPPSIMMSMTLSRYSKWDDQTWSQQIGQTPSAQLISMFRFWRGSMRFVIVCDDDVSSPLYVTHIPHSGVRMIGNQAVGVQTTYGNNDNKIVFERPPFGVGMRTEILVPSVNKTLSIEVPYLTENVWTYVMEETPNSKTQKIRERGDTNAGHLVLTSDVARKVTIFWAAGDDFQLSYFLGPFKGYKNDWAYQYFDAPIVFQSDSPDFHSMQSSGNRGLLSTFMSRVKNNVTSVGGFLARNPISVLGAVPYVGDGLKSVQVASILQSVVQTDDAIPKTLYSLKHTAQNIDDITTEMRRTILQPHNSEIFIWFQTQFQIAFDKLSVSALNMGERISNFIIDLIIAWISNSWVVTSIVFLRLIYTVLQLPLSSITTDMITRVSEFLASINNQEVQPNASSVCFQADYDTGATMAGLIAGIVGTALRVVIDGKKYSSYFVGFIHQFTTSQGISYFNNILRLTSTVIECVKDMVMTHLGYASVERESLELIATDNPELQNFINDAQLILNDVNNRVQLLPQYRQFFWITLARAYKYQAAMCRVDSRAISGPFVRLVQDVIKKGNERMIDVSSSPVRFEPYVICIEGPTNIGKSFMTEQFCYELLRANGIKIPTGEAAYIRQPGTPFWSGYNMQPVIIMDEWGNLNDPSKSLLCIEELFCLKTPQTFIPNMAHLEEKRIRANPVIIVLCCNDAFPTSLRDLATHPEALWRRRDLIIRAELQDDLPTTNIRELAETNPQFTQDFGHLQFHLYKDSTDHGSLDRCRTFNYAQLQECVGGKFARYVGQEKINMQKRMDRIVAALPGAQMGIDPFATLYGIEQRALVDIPFQPHQYLPASQIMDFARQLENVINELPEEEPGLQEPEYPVPNFDIVDLGLGVFFGVDAPFYFARMSADAIANLLRDKPTYFPSEECYICRERKNYFFVCGETEFGPLSHAVCSECFRAGIETGVPVRQCGVCRCTSIVTKKSNTDIVFYRWLYALKKAGVVTASQLSIGLEMYQDSILYTFIRSLQTIQVLASMVICGPEPVTVGYLIGRSLWSACQYVPELQGQADPPVEAVDVLREYLRQDLIGHLDEDRVRYNHSSPVGSPQCNHEYISTRLNLLMYHRGPTGPGSFRCLRDGSDRWVVASERPCQGSCYFSDYKLYHHFCTSYFNLKKHHYNNQRRNIAQCRSEERQRELILDFPLFMLPTPYEPINNFVTLSSWWDFMSNIWDQHKTIIKVCAGILGVVGTATGMFYLYDSLSGLAGQGPYPSMQPRHINITPRQPIDLSNQSAGIEVAVEQRVARNTIIISFNDSSGMFRSLAAVGICSRFVVMPKHYVRVLKECHEMGWPIFIHPAKYGLDNCHEKKEYTFCDKDFTLDEKNDVAVFTLPASFPMFKDIRKYFLTEEDISKGIPGEATFMEVPHRLNPTFKPRVVRLTGIKQKIEVRQSLERYEVMNVLEYNFSQRGACSSLLYVPRSQRPIIAMHVAGTVGDGGYQGVGYGIILTAEILNSMFDSDHHVFQMEDVILRPLEEANFVIDEPDCNLVYMGCVPPNKQPAMATRTKMKPSLVQGVNGLVPKTAPTILSPKDPRFREYNWPSSPLRLGVKKHGIHTRDFRTQDVQRVVSALWNGWYMGLKPIIPSPKKFSPEEAVVGLPNVRYYEQMKLKTSSGWPWVFNGKTQKTAWITAERDENLQMVSCTLDPVLKEEMQRKEELRCSGIVPMSVFIDSLKDERKLIAKVKKPGSTRVFCAAPIDEHIAMRQSFMHYVAAVEHAKFKVMSGVGINPHGSDWSLLYRYLTEVSSSNIVQLDYHNFGPGFNSVVCSAAFELMIKWTLENVEGVTERELRALAENNINSVHLAGNTIYKQTAGSPSGGAVTTPVNSEVNKLYIMLAWLALCEERALTKNCDIWEEFRRCIRLVVYGDDLIMSVSDEYADIFNSLTIQEYFTIFRITVSNADKEVELEPFVHISQAQFLKRRFKKHPTRDCEVMGPLDWETIEDIPQWIWQSPNHAEQTRVNCVASMYQAHGHGPEVFNNFKKKINKALAKVDIIPLTLEWESVDNQFYEEGFMGFEYFH